MIPASLLASGRGHWEVVPKYLTEADYPWLQVLTDEYDRFAGRRRCELGQRLGEPLPVACPADKLKLARLVLDKLWQERSSAAIRPRRTRKALFGAAGRRRNREQAISEACAELGVTPDALMEALFADLPDQRRLVPPAEPTSLAELAVRCNQELVFALIRRSVEVRIWASGNVRALVRHAKLRGLLCWVRAEPDARAGDLLHAAELRFSGPFALFRRTLVYGRALASLVGRLAWCERFELRAPLCLEPQGAARELLIRSGDPIFPGRELKRFDSAVEERFFGEFARAAPDWDLVREPQAVRVGAELIFPDFALRHRRDPDRYWLLEIMGFWTRAYVERKLGMLGRANLDRFILCIDVDRKCADDELPPAARVIRYRRRVRPADVLAVIEAE